MSVSRRIGSALKIAGNRCLAAAALFSLHRAVFLVLNWPPDRPDLAELAPRLLVGLRFDAAAAPILLWPLALFLPAIAAFAERADRVRRLCAAQDLALAALFAAAHAVLLASAYNYRFNAKHLGWELFAYANDAPGLIAAAASEAPALFALAALSFAPGIMFVVQRARRLVRAPEGAADGVARNETADRSGVEPTWAARLLAAGGVALIVIATLLVAARGGWQESPLRAADALATSSNFLNNLALNGVFTTSRDREDQLDFARYFPPAENQAVVRALLDQPDAFVSAEYPLLRYMPRTHAGQAPHIALIILESFTAKFLAEHGGDPRIAPELQAQIPRGLYFEQFYASGGRSANGLVSMLAGLPDRAGRTILRSNQMHNRFGGAAALLRKRGYRTVFLHGGPLSFDNLDRALPQLGFESALGLDELRGRTRAGDASAAGLHDAALFRFALEEFDRRAKEDQPLFLTLFTLNTHHPFPLPADAPRIFSSAEPEADYLNAYHYADRALGDFLRAARARPWAANTIFVITADHAHHRNLNYMEDRRIPLLLLGARLPAGRSAALASQLDVGPTLLALAGGDALYAHMGRPLVLGPERAAELRPRAGAPEPGVFFAAGSGTNAIGWIDAEWYFATWLGGDRRALLPARPPYSLEDACAARPAVCSERLFRARHYHQFARWLEAENRIWPEPSEADALLQRAREKVSR